MANASAITPFGGNRPLGPVKKVTDIDPDTGRPTKDMGSATVIPGLRPPQPPHRPTPPSDTRDDGAHPQPAPAPAPKPKPAPAPAGDHGNHGNHAPNPQPHGGNGRNWQRWIIIALAAGGIAAAGLILWALFSGPSTPVGAPAAAPPTSTSKGAAPADAPPPPATQPPAPPVTTAPPPPPAAAPATPGSGKTHVLSQPRSSDWMSQHGWTRKEQVWDAQAGKFRTEWKCYGTLNSDDTCTPR